MRKKQTKRRNFAKLYSDYTAKGGKMSKTEIGKILWPNGSARQLAAKLFEMGEKPVTLTEEQNLLLMGIFGMSANEFYSEENFVNC